MKKMFICLFAVMVSIMLVSPIVTTATVNDTRVDISLSSRDTTSGMSTVAGNVFKRFDSDNNPTINDVLYAFGFVDDSGSWTGDITDVISNPNGYTVSDIYYEIITSKNGLVGYGYLSEYTSTSSSIENGGAIKLSGSDNYTLNISTVVDEETAGELEGAGGDGIDDRDQVSYVVRLQYSVGSAYYVNPDKVLWANSDDDIVELVSGGSYSLPGWDEVVIYDNELYFYHYEVDYDNGTIYAHYVNTDDGSTITAVEASTSTLSTESDDTDDSVVDCDSLYNVASGTLAWDAYSATCVYISSNSGIIIPNTSTR